eukprot:9488407-Ditylum_brightwellii.AAC.1
MMGGNFIMFDGKMKISEEMKQQEVIYSLTQGRGYWIPMYYSALVLVHALFFYPLILPMCNVAKYGVTCDPLMNYYSEVETRGNIYAAILGLSDTYPKKFESIKIDELVRWNGILVCDGVRGGSGGALHGHREEGADHDLYFDECMKHCLSLQMKCCYNLNNNKATLKRGEENYDPAYEFDYL